MLCRFMSRDKYLDFIVASAAKLHTALFTDCSPSDQKFRSSVIRLMRTDEDGRLYFTVSTHLQDISGYASAFYAQLQFFQKEIPYHITMEGKAIPCFKPGAPPEREMMIAFEVQHAAYYNRKVYHRKPVMGRVRKLMNWIFDERIIPATEIYFH